MSLWTFQCYESPNGKRVMDTWRETLSKRARVRFDSIIRHLRDMLQSKWESPPQFPYAKRLEHGIWEIRFRVDNVQHRPLGFFGPARGHFTLVMGAEEKNGRFVPKNALKTAIRRKKECEEGRAKPHEYTHQ